MSKNTGVKLCSPFSTRLKVGLLLLFGLFCATLMRICLSMAVVCMKTSDPNITYSAEMQISELSLRGKQQTFGWSSTQITLLLSATFYGGLLTTFWSGYLSDRFSPKYVILFGVLDCVVVTAFTPLLARSEFYTLFIARIVMGLGEDFISPAQTSFINRWYSPTEMARIGAFTITGKALAGTVGFPVSSYLCQLQEIDGWRLMFYTFAILGGIWIIIWGIYATSSPSKHRCISSEEKEYILEELKQLEMNHDPDDPKLYKGSIPWKSILTSKAVIINLICQFTFNFSEAILSAYLPTYIDQVLKLDLNQNGYFAMISFFAQLIFQILFGIFTDMIHKKDVISGTTSCKLCQGLENFLCALSYLGLGFLANKDHLFLAGMFLVFNGIGTAASVGGFMTAQPSLAPQYAGIISSILRTTAALGALSSINVVGFINKEGTPIQWRTIWIIAASLNVVTGIIFLIGGEAETQEWAKNDETENDKTLSSRKSSTEHPLTNE